METWQLSIISIFGITSLVGLIQAYRQCTKKNSSYGKPPKLYMLFGSLVWADHLVFGAFWVIISLFCLMFHDFLLFLLTFSVFWLVRSIGETIYWFFQQFTPRHGNEPEKFIWHRIVKNDSVWFLNQIYWQCITVITIITSVYLFSLWLPIHLTK